MMTAKRIAHGAVLALVVAVSGTTAAVLLVDDATLVAWQAKRIELKAGVSIKYQEPPELTRTLSPTLSVSEQGAGQSRVA